METVNEITDAQFEAMRACVQFPLNPRFSEEIKIFRALAEQAI